MCRHPFRRQLDAPEYGSPPEIAASGAGAGLYVLAAACGRSLTPAGSPDATFAPSAGHARSRQEVGAMDGFDECPFDVPVNQFDVDDVDELATEFGEYDPAGPFGGRDAFPGPD